MKYPILTISLIGLIACNISTQTKKVQVKSSIDTVHISDNNANVISSENDFYFHGDAILPGKILLTGTFHDDEVWDKADKENWFGLFKSNDSYYVANTSITAKRVHDEIVDENETEKTGWEVQTTNKDTSLLLFARLNSVPNGEVQEIDLPKNQIFPGDTLKFIYLGAQYELFATGNKNQDRSDAEAFEVSNYKLYLKAAKDGKVITELLVAQPRFDDQMTTLLFAGDLDGDGFADFIIDASNHYNATVPTLYLSKPADKEHLLRVVGQHVSVGC